jgi:hypothetical protein
MVDPEGYGGEEALVVVWARRVLQRGDSLVAELKARVGLVCGVAAVAEPATAVGRKKRA